MDKIADKMKDEKKSQLDVYHHFYTLNFATNLLVSRVSC